jgi:cell wall-associated NlpC family hydrolase
LSRLLAIVVLLALFIAAPAALAASGSLTPAPPESNRPSPRAPVAAAPSAAQLALRQARAEALTAYRHARLLAHRAGLHLRPPRSILHATRPAALHRWTRVWQRHVRTYRRLVFREMRGKRAVHAALSQLGTPYSWGGASPAGFDCSGLVMWAYHHAGINLPHSTYALMAVGRRVSRANLRPGDLVFSEGGGHVGLYIGHGVVVHAPHSGTVVERSPLGSWSVVAFRRVF